jgi:hypothetical protein
MTRSLLLAAALLGLSFPAAAQVSLGLKAGLNTSFWTGDDAEQTDPRLGFAGGATLRYDVNRALALQTEVLYSQKGAELGSTALADFSVRQDYVEIPVLARVAVPVSRFADAGIYAGPSFGIPINAELVGEGDNGSASQEADANTDIGVTAGVDYFSGPFGVDLRYTMGLTDPLESVPVLGNPDVRNQAFTASFVYRFGR